MLSSITPLGERSRGSSWAVTASAFAIGAIATGAAAGALLGAAGAVLPGGERWRVLVLLAAIVGVLAFDATPLRARLPTTRRQVNEDWLGRYRGWVYGLAFGSQLGLGVVTIVTSAAVYATGVAALLTGDPWLGALIGAAFGLIRGLSLLPARRVGDQLALMALHRKLTGVEQSVRRAVLALELLLAVLLVGWIL